MKARNCCKTMEMELTGWKAIVYDIARKMEKLPSGEKENILPPCSGPKKGKRR